MKTNLDKLFKLDKNASENGVWFEISEETGFLLLPFKSSNPKVKAAHAKYFKPVIRQINMGTLSAEKEAELLAKVFVESSLIDWKGVQIDGEDIPFSKDKAVEVLKGLPELLDSLIRFAEDTSAYREDTEELGNS